MTPTDAMKLLALATLCIFAGPLLATEKTEAIHDPFAGAFFPPELVLLARDRIGMTTEQRTAFRDRVEKARPRSEELRASLARENEVLTALVNHDRVDEAALSAQLEKVLTIEGQLKHLHAGLLAAIKNALTPGQQARLRDLAKDGGAALAEDARRRLSEKVESVKAGVQKWTASGRDPSAITQAMEEKFKPLADAGQIIEAEAELDRVLEQLAK